MTDHLDDVLDPGDNVARAMLASTKWLSRDYPDDPLRLVDVDDMEPSHQRNLLGYLRDHAREMHFYARMAIEQQFERGEIDSIERATHMTMLGAMPDLWIERTVLYRRLHLLVHGRPERRRFLPARLRRTR